MKKFIVSVFSLATLIATSAFASGGGEPLKDIKWPFEGPLGKFDRPAVQRGYQVYKEVCASCHSMKYMHFRNLQQIGFSEAEVKEIAAGYQVKDGPDDSGDMFDRPGRPSDRFPSPFANEKAARASNGGAFPPDLSLMVKARPDGANYVYSLLTGYETAPQRVEIPAGQYYNKYFPGHNISMAPPLADGRVDYMDGTANTMDQMSKDLVNFLQWAAEPEMEDRNRIGLKAMLFLAIFTILFYLAKRAVWRRVK